MHQVERWLEQVLLAFTYSRRCTSEDAPQIEIKEEEASDEAKEPLEIELAPEDEWEVEQGSEEEQESETPDLSDKAISYLAQIQDLQEQFNKNS